MGGYCILANMGGYLQMKTNMINFFYLYFLIFVNYYNVLYHFTYRLKGHSWKILPKRRNTTFSLK